MSSSTVGGLLVEEDEVEDEVQAKSSGEVVPPVLGGGSARTYVPLKAKHLVRLVQKMSHAKPLKLSGMDLQGLSLCGMDLTGARLFRCDLRGVDFQWANLTEATLTDCNLTGANLKGAKPHHHPRADNPWLIGSALVDATLCRTYLGLSVMRGACLEGTLAPPASSSTSAGQRARRSLPWCTRGQGRICARCSWPAPTSPGRTSPVSTWARKTSQGNCGGALG